MTNSDLATRRMRTAGEQMALHLSGAFRDSRDFRVINALRLERGRDYVAIDHLVLHRFGAILIDSSSLPRSIATDRPGDLRLPQSGGSDADCCPFLLVARQGRYLRSYLRASAGKLRGKILGLIQAGFIGMSVDGIVSLADGAAPESLNTRSNQSVIPAGQAPDRVRAIFEGYRRKYAPRGLDFPQWGYRWTVDELHRIQEFLISEHRPFVPPAELSARASCLLNQWPVSPARPSKPIRSRPAVDWLCLHCDSTELSPVLGRYGNHLRCRVCKGNTPLLAHCQECGKPERVRASQGEFFRECRECDVRRTMVYPSA